MFSSDGGGFSIVPLQVVRSSPSRSRGSVRRREAAERFRGGGAGLLGIDRPATSQSRATWRLNMKTMKSLVLGSAAALVAMSGAQAADLPVKAKAVEYVKICSL